MKISKLSLVLLSGLLVTQATMPMETPANSALKKAQKAGKIALKIGAGTVAFGVYALGTSIALTSLGITAGAVALSLARLLEPKPSKTLRVAPEAPKAPAATSPKVSVKRPAPMPEKSKKPSKNRTIAYTKTAAKTASLGAVAVMKEGILDEHAFENRMTKEQMMQLKKQQQAELRPVIDTCEDQKIQWNKDYKSVYRAEIPRFEGPYQDMIGIHDADLEDMRHEVNARMQDQIEFKWKQAGCAESAAQMRALARSIAQDQMRFTKNV